MDRLLKHTPTGDVYIYTALLAKRDDMELVVVEEAPEPVVVEPKRNTRKAAAPQPDTEE